LEDGTVKDTRLSRHGKIKDNASNVYKVLESWGGIQSVEADRFKRMEQFLGDLKFLSWCDDASEAQSYYNICQLHISQIPELPSS